MAGIVEILKNIDNLQIQSLPDEWVQTVWDSDFTEIPQHELISLNQDEGRLVQSLQNLRSELSQCVAENNDDNQEVWTELIEKGIPVQVLVAYIASLIVTGVQKKDDVTRKVIGCRAAQVYTKLLLTPGSNAFKVFHPEIYERSVDYLKLMVVTSQKDTPQKKKRKRKHSYDQEETLSGSLERVSLDEDTGNNDSIELKACLRELLSDVVLLLEKYSLKHSGSSATHTVQIFIGLCRMDLDKFDGNFDSRVPNRLRCVAALGFKGLYLLCSPHHRMVGNMLSQTCKGFLPGMLYLVDNNPVQHITKPLQIVCDSIVSFIGYLLKNCGNKAHEIVYVLLQHMCIKVTDRAEYRTKVAQTVVNLTRQLSDERYCKLVQWFYKLSKHDEINNRAYSIEIVSTFLSFPERRLKELIHPDLLPYLSHRSLLGIIIDRCSDKAPTVRARAIASFAQCLSSKETGIVSAVNEMMTPLALDEPRIVVRLIKTPAPRNTTSLESIATMVQDETSAQVSEQTEQETPSAQALNKVALTPGFNLNVSDREGLFSMLRRRAKDDKVHVRKAAIQALESAVRFEAPHFTKENVEVLKDHCRDPGLSVRKQAMQSLHDLLQELPTDLYIQENWLEGVLPLVYDRETTVSEKCFEILEEVFLSRIVAKNKSTTDHHSLTWSLLGIIAQPQSVDQRRYLQKACHHWSKQGKIKAKLISDLETHIETENYQAAWMVLAEISPAAPKIGHTLLMNFWRAQDTQESSIEVMECAFTVTRNVVKHLPIDERNWLRDNLKARLLSFNSPFELISATVKTLAKIYELESKDSGSTRQTDWCKEVIDSSDKYLSKIILEENSQPYDEQKVICHVFTLGEVILLCPSLVKKRIILLVQSMIATPCIASDIQSQPLTQNNNTSSTSQTSDDSSNRAEGEQDCNTSHGSGDPAPSQSTQSTQSTQSSQPLTQFRGSKMSPRVRGFAFVTFGKLSLQNEKLAKKCVPAMAKELEVAEDPAVRNNVMMIMCDLCVRYTTVANNYVGNISSMLKDRTPLIRKQALTLITRLVQEDYLKWKGELFYRFISTFLDQYEEIRNLSEYYLVHMLLHRHPDILFQHFVECIFHFNDYTTHRIYNRFTQTVKDKEKFSLKGNKNRQNREKLYRFQLDHMSDEHKFQLQNKICQEILAAIVDGVMPFDQTTTDLLKDSLAILSCKEIKLTTVRAPASEDVPTDDKEKAAVVVAVAKKKIITQVLKKNVIEIIVPIVISLKQMMEKERSPLHGDLMCYMRELMKDYKNEVKEILHADKRLAAEIEYDLKKFEEQQAHTTAQVQTPVVVNVQSPTIEQQTESRAGSRPGTPSRSGTPNRLSPIHGHSPRQTPAMKDKLIPAPILQLIKTVQQATNSVIIRKTPAIKDKLIPAPILQLMKTVQQATNRSRVQDSENQTAEMETDNDDNDKENSDTRTPAETNKRRGRTTRAISTPSVAMGNITFHGEGNVTILPPSPIPERTSMEKNFDQTTHEDEETVIGGSADK